MFFYDKIDIPFQYLSNESRNSKVFTFSFAIIGSIAATALKFINNARTSENRNFIFECEKIDQLALSLEYNWKITKGEFVFHYTINSSANLKRKFTQIWQYYHQVLLRHCTCKLSALILCSKIILHVCQRSHVGNYFYTRYFLLYLFHEGISKNPNTKGLDDNTTIFG